MIERGAKAMFAELMRQHEATLGSTYVEEASDMERVLVDGRIDLPALMRAAIEAMREPTEAMVEAQLVWSDMIDAALGIPPKL